MPSGVPDTIVALSSGAVPAGVAVLRLSGPQAADVLVDMVGRLPEARRLVLAEIRLEGEVLDKGLIAWMPGPNSFTGEDCAELHLHGSPAVVRAVLRKLTALPNIRLAEAGEFTRRAFENGKLDLTEAQGLSDLIVAETENQRALAHARMEGGLTRQVESWRERLLDLRALVEAQLDFSDEGDVGDLPANFNVLMRQLADDVGIALRTKDRGRIVRSGFRVVLAGPPNAGKSSLLNALSRSDAAIVSDEPGTTRDIKEVPLDIDGQLVILVDSAGLRETSSKAEAIGIDRARAAIAGADLVLWLTAPDVEAADLPEAVSEHGSGTIPLLRIGTKSDIGSVDGADLSVSIKDGTGISALLQRLHAESGSGAFNASELLVSHERDRIALQDAISALGQAIDFGRQPELLAEALRIAGNALERLLGRIDAEQVLDALFSRFCIGK